LTGSDNLVILKASTGSFTTITSPVSSILVPGFLFNNQ